MGSSRKWHHSCTAGLISTDKKQKLSAHAMFSSPPSKNKRECLELLENLTSWMLYISLVFSPQATSQKYRWSTDCPVAQPFPLQFAACLPCYQGFLPFVAALACLPRKAGALASNSTAKAVVFAPPHSILTFAFSPVILAQFSKVYHRTSRARDGTFFSIPQSCFSIMSLTAPSHPRLIKFHHLLQWGNFLCQHYRNTIHLFVGLLLHSAPHITPAGCACHMCTVGHSLSIFQYMLHTPKRGILMVLLHRWISSPSGGLQRLFHWLNLEPRHSL